ncbi:MAG: nucleotidyl transferase AbiEii/AbiGii toxin family protein, partial [Anaerolineae bacterium]
ILERGKARDYYDVWRLLKEKHDGFNSATVYATLLAKCAHKGLSQPSIELFFTPRILDQAQAYWVNDLADQIKPNLLPPWEQVVTELRTLLTNLFSQGS